MPRINFLFLNMNKIYLRCIIVAHDQPTGSSIGENCFYCIKKRQNDAKIRSFRDL